MNIYIETYGCSANQNSGEIMAGLLSRNGFIIVSNEKIADIAILNSCIVKGPTLQKMLSRICVLKKHKHLIVAGCMPDVLSNQILRIAPKASLVGSHHINEIINAVKNILENKQVRLVSKQKEEHLCKPKNYKNKLVGIAQISEGCVGDCSFCLVRLAKGSLNSYEEDKILKSIQLDLQSGCKEIWLTSQDCSAYGLDKPSKKEDIITLLNKIFYLKGKFLVRIGMSNPNNVKIILNKFIEAYKNGKVFKFLHIPLQSGSDKVLEDMNRYYKAADFEEIIRFFRKEIPEITISTDIIVGYPTETEEDFRKTLILMNKTRPDIINISRFWPMPKTKAALLKQLKPAIIMGRSKELMKLHNKIALEKNNSWINWTGKVLVDEQKDKNLFIARNLSYKPIIISSRENILSKFVDVKITKADSHYLIGEIIASDTHILGRRPISQCAYSWSGV